MQESETMGQNEQKEHAMAANKELEEKLKAVTIEFEAKKEELESTLLQKQAESEEAK